MIRLPVGEQTRLPKRTQLPHLAVFALSSSQQWRQRTEVEFFSTMSQTEVSTGVRWSMFVGRVFSTLRRALTGNYKACAVFMRR